MPKVDDAKVRLLAVYRMLETGEKLTSTEILKRLDAQFGITADRKTIYSDFCAIDRFFPLMTLGGKCGGCQKYDVLKGCDADAE